MMKKQVSVRLDDDLLRKLRVVAQREGRPASRQARFMIRTYIHEFEKAHGEIQIQQHTSEDTTAVSE